MDAVCINVDGNLHAVIYHKRNMILGTQAFQFLCFLLKGSLIQVFLPDLQKCCPMLQHIFAYICQFFAFL